MFRSWKCGTLLGVDLYLHGSLLLPVIYVALRGWLFLPNGEWLLQGCVLALTYASILGHESAHLAIARYLRVPVRDVTVYPFGGVPRLGRLSERPWQEIWINIVGPITHALIAGLCAGGLLLADRTLAPHVSDEVANGEALLNRVMWFNITLGILHILPAFPLDGGRMMAALLSMSMPRLRAIDYTAILSSFIAIFCLVAGMIWLHSVWWLMLLGVVIHVSGQQALMDASFFDSLRRPGLAGSASVPALPVDVLLEEDHEPIESDFTGFTWNPKARLWIVWEKGQPVSANALIGH